MKQKYLLLLLLAIFCGGSISAQPLSAYTNFQQQFVVWDNGMIRKIEHLEPLKVKIGRVAIPYIDNSRNFKIYYKGGVTKINSGFTQDFQVTDNLITFENAKALLVWEQGTTTTLSNYCEQFYTGDSLVVYFDGVQKEFRAYYDGRVYPIENFLAGSSASHVLGTGGNKVSEDMQIASGQLPSVKVSDNIAAYVNYSNQFKIFYRGRVITAENYLIENFDVGRNTVAYVNANQQFNIFHAGTIRHIADFPPLSYVAGDDLVAFVDNNNSFKIYYQDSVYNLGYLQPEYQVTDNIVAFEDATGYFKVFYKGKIYTLESYFPDDLVMGYNSVAYVNRANILRLFTAGNLYDVTSASVADWRLDFDVIQYRFGRNMYKIFYKGKTY